MNSLGRIISAVVNAIYTLVSSITSWISGGSPLPSGWQWTERTEIDERLSDIHKLIKTFMQAQGIKAAQCAIRINGALKLNTGYTWAEPEYRPTEADSVMRIASCSKNFTTAAIFKLLTQRKVDINTRVFEFLGITEDLFPGTTAIEPPDARVRNIVVRDLIEHSAGWDYITPIPFHATDPVFALRKISADMALGRPPKKEEFARYMFHQHLDFTPGTRIVYSNVGYLLLGMVIEKASGKSYINYLMEDILPDDGISDVFVGSTRLSGRRSNEVLYDDPLVGPDATDPGSPILVPYPYGGSGAMTELMDSGGGLVTSARSLSLFIRKHNIWVGSVSDLPGRKELRRDGNMPGNNAISECFSFKDKSGNNIEVDYVMLFNRYRVGNKIGGTENIQFERLVREVKRVITRQYS